MLVQNGCYDRDDVTSLMYGHSDDQQRFSLLCWAALFVPILVFPVLETSAQSGEGRMWEGHRPRDVVAARVYPAASTAPAGRHKGMFRRDGIVFLINDWMTSTLPLILNAYFRPRGIYLKSRVVLAIHNLAHQVCLRYTSLRMWDVSPLRLRHAESRRSLS